MRRADRQPLQLIGDSDRELLAGIAASDPLAFEALYQRYARPFYGFALRRLGDPNRAEDAVQDAFTAVWRGAATYDPERGSAAAWLFGIARNAVVDWIRQSARERDSIDDAPEAASSERSPHECAEDDWLRFCTHAALAELPERERVPLELAYWHGLSQSEIARRLRLPLGTIKTRTRSGLARLAVVLEGRL